MALTVTFTEGDLDFLADLVDFIQDILEGAEDDGVPGDDDE